jgi:hypothetical protein
LAAVALAGKEVATRFSLSRRDQLSEQLMGDIKQVRAVPETPVYDRWLESLAGEIAYSACPRCVIADGLERLDIETRRVVERYVTGTVRQAATQELWILFQDSEAPGLAPLPMLRAQTAEGSDGRSTVAFFQQIRLSATARTELADEVGLPSRGGFHRPSKQINGS